MASKDPKDQPAHEPESEELRELLAELQDENATLSDAQSPLLPGRERAALWRRLPKDSDLNQALAELHQDLLNPDPGASSADAAPAPAARFGVPIPPRHRAVDDADGHWEEYQNQLAGMAARILIRQTSHSPGEQRALNIPDTALAQGGPGWRAAVLLYLEAQPPERIFAAWVRSLDDWMESEVFNLLAAEAAAQLTTTAPYVAALGAVQRHVILRRTASFMTVLQAAPVDAAMVHLLTALLGSLERRSGDEQRAIAELAGRVAQKRPDMAVAIASKARQLRQLPYQQQIHHLSELQALAVAVRAAALPALIPTATLGLTIGYGGAAKEWALALLHCDAGDCLRRLLDPERGIIGSSFGRGIDLVAEVIAALPDDAATAMRRRSLLEHPDPYLRLEIAYRNPDARRRIVEICAILASLELAPGWVALYPQRDRVLRFMQEKYVKADWNKLASRYGRPLPPLPPPLTPLQAVTARHTELRHRALRNLAQAGQPEHLLAALLAADLDRALAAHGHSAVWRFVAWGRFPKLKLDALKYRWSGGSLTALLALVRRLTQLGVLSEQHLSPELAELQRLGATAYAARYPTPERLEPAAQAALQLAEAAFISSAPDRPN